MAQAKRLRKIGVLLAVVFALVVFAAPWALAASEKVDDILATLQQMQSAQIDPAWEPDIVANQQLVQALLDDYTALDAAEKAEFTPQQNTDLRAYFETLYNIQGKNVSGLDAVFAGGQGSSSSSAGSSSSADASSSQPDSSLAPSSSDTGSSLDTSASGSSVGNSSTSAAGSSSVGASSVGRESSSLPQQASSLPGALVDVSGASSSASVPGTTQTPQVPDGGGILGGSAFGTIILAVLVLLCAVLLIRFVLALRAAGKAQKTEREDDERARELFGENYDLEHPGESPEDTITPAGHESKIINERVIPAGDPPKEEPPAHKYASGPITRPVTLHPLDEAEKSGIALGSESIGDTEDAADKPEDTAAKPEEKPEDKPAGPVKRLASWLGLDGKEKPADEAAEGTGDATAETAAEKSPMESAFQSAAAALNSGAALSSIQPAEKPKPEAPAQQNPAGNTAPQPEAEAGAADKAPAASTERPAPGAERGGIAMRSFSGAARTGKPSKMPFRQGSPDDLDAIDE